MSRQDLLSSVSQYGLFSMRYFQFSNPNKLLKQRRRDEFGLAIRSLFLRYLIKVESREMQRIFDEEQLHDLSCGSKGFDFNTHHIHGIDIGGTNYNPELTSEINKVFLPAREMRHFSHRTYPAIVFGRRMEYFLREKEQHGQLDKTFRKLFSGYLVFMPVDLHETLEQKLIYPSITEARKNGEQRVLLPYTTRLLISPKSKEYCAMKESGAISPSIRKITSQGPINSPAVGDNSNQRAE